MINLYGIIYALAFIVNFFIIKKYLKKQNKEENLAYTAIIYTILGVVIGARLFYVFYYNPNDFIQNPIEFFYIWKGGLSFHGGLLGLIISSYIFCKRNKISFLEFGDLITTSIVFFLAIGRIANFLNSELYGKPTNLPWCINFENVESCRHPVQLYSALKNFILFLFLIYLKNTRKLKKGMIMFGFIFLYSLSRFFIDFFREYQNVYFGLGSGQYLNIITIIISGLFLLSRFSPFLKKNTKS